MHVTYANFKVGSLPTSSCIFIVLHNQLAKYTKFHMTYNDPALVLEKTPLKHFMHFRLALTHMTMKRIEKVRDCTGEASARVWTVMAGEVQCCSWLYPWKGIV